MARVPAEVRLQSIPAVMKGLAMLADEIREAPSFAELDRLARQAREVQRRWKPVKDVADRAGRCWVSAERRLGQELGKCEKAKGTRGQFVGVSKAGKGRGRGKGFSAGKAKVVPPALTTTDAERGVDKRQAARARKLAELGDNVIDALEAELIASNKAVTSDAVLVLDRMMRKREKKRATVTAAFSAQGPFDVAVVDPPWETSKIDREVRPNQDAYDYPTMTVDELRDFWQREMAPRLKDDCHVFTWATQRYLPAALDFLNRVGLHYVLTMVWHKAGGFQPVDLPQYNCEFVIYARKGHPVFVDTKNFFCCFTGNRREHSRKPDAFYDLVRRVTGGSRVDVFSREPRDGFAQYGDETNRFADCRPEASP